MSFIFVLFFPDIRQYFRTFLKKGLENKKLATLEQFRIIYGTLSKYFRPLDKLMQAVDALQTEFRNYKQTVTSHFCLTRTYIWYIWV